MNITASSPQSTAVSSRMDAPSTNDAPADGDSTGDAAQDFGQILSVTVSRDASPTTGEPEGRMLNGSPVDPKALFVANGDARPGAASPDVPVALDLNAVLGGRMDAPKGVGTDSTVVAKATDDAKPTDDATPSAGDDLSAQLAMLAQWTGPTPAAAETAVSTGDGADTDVATRGLPALAALPGADGAAVPAESRGRVPRAEAVGDVAAADPATMKAPAVLDVAAVVASGSARQVAASGVDAVTSKSDRSKPVDAARGASRDSITAVIEKILNVPVAGTTSTVPDPGSMANPFVTQIAAQVSSAKGTLAPAATDSSIGLRETVATPAWSHELGQAAIRMATDDLQHASLRLNPEHLGPLDVQMRIDNGIAHMQFAAAHPETRAALEGSRATLDQMFGDQGIKLGDWSVGNASTNSSFARQFGSASSQGGDQRSPAGDSEGTDGSTTVTMRAARPLGLVDTFA